MLQTETFETISEFRAMLTGHGQAAQREHVFGTRALTPTPVVIQEALTVSPEQEAENTKPEWMGRLLPKNHLLFAPSLDARIKVRVPFSVLIKAAEGGVMAQAEEIDEFGFGVNRGEALDDLARTISELYFSLTADRDRLSAHLTGTLKVLEGHVDRIHK